MKCRHCATELGQLLIDLGTAPPSNSFLSLSALDRGETWLPLRVRVCESCWLVQTEDTACPSSLFDDEYVYFSGFSAHWLRHAERFADEISRLLDLSPNSRVVEIAANDGSTLQFFHARGMPSLGIEPTASTARAARAKGLSILESFFGLSLAEELVVQGHAADLIVANNVLAHVPDINDFLAGIRVLLNSEGVVSFEFPSLLCLLEQCQFDTVYHEHFSYLSLHAVIAMLRGHGLAVLDVQELSTHGGSLRVLACRDTSARLGSSSDRVTSYLRREQVFGIMRAEVYAQFQPRAERVKDELLSFLLQAKRAGKRVVGYGAAAKGNTLLNFAGVRADLLPFVVDRNPVKQGKFLPGSRIPVLSEDHLALARPDYVLILPWNLRRELSDQLTYVADWGAQLLVAIPELEVFAPLGQ